MEIAVDAATGTRVPLYVQADGGRRRDQHRSAPAWSAVLRGFATNAGRRDRHLPALRESSPHPGDPEPSGQPRGQDHRDSRWCCRCSVPARSSPASGSARSPEAAAPIDPQLRHLILLIPPSHQVVRHQPLLGPRPTGAIQPSATSGPRLARPAAQLPSKGLRTGVAPGYQWWARSQGRCWRSLIFSAAFSQRETPCPHPDCNRHQIG